MASTSEDAKLSYRRSKRLRKDSSSELSIEELLPDDMGYDADVEALHPDIYEEPESDTESIATPKRKFHTIDEELAARMKHLGHERSGTNSPQKATSARGRKRRILHEEVVQSRRGRTSDLEVVELVERSNTSPPKKRMKRSRPSSLNHMSDRSRQRLSEDIDRMTTDRTEVNDAMDTT
ncbi:hypothetical protein PMZ80_010103 [Knufia obscura]|uniref:Uncharacterized protein n=1 Tax=Knufia obscura TaxID=1635080 RepID=A0ABR0RA46_9EURO|nr:hypothetical protein PMZ80_010103 [Knufia obscura]